MNKNFILPLVCLAIGVFVTAFVMVKCSDRLNVGPAIVTRDTIYIPSNDQVHNITPTAQPAPTYVTNNYTYEAAANGPIDTGKVLRDYFNRRGYMDTVRNDSIDIILHEEVYKNELKRVKVGYKWKAPERLVKETKTIYPNHFNLGLAPGFFAQPTFGFYGSYEMKKMGIGVLFDPIQKGGYIIFSKRFNLKH